MSSVVLERYILPVHYEAETPEKKFDIHGKVTTSSYDPQFTVHLNQYRPSWALAGMRTLLLKKKQLASGSPESESHVVSFTLTLWLSGLNDYGFMGHYRIVTTLREAAREIEGVGAIESVIVKLVKTHVDRPVKERNAPKPPDIPASLDRVKRQIRSELSSQDGVSVTDLIDRIDAVKEDVREIAPS